MNITFKQISVFILLGFLSLWSMDIFLIPYSGDYFAKGTSGEFFDFAVSILLSILFWVLIVIYPIFCFIKNKIKNKKTISETDVKKDELSTFKDLVTLIVIGLYLVGLVSNFLFAMEESTNNGILKKSIIDSIINSYYFYWNLILVVLVCLIKHNSKTLKNILLHINLFTLTFLLISLSIVSTSNKMINVQNTGGYIAKSMYCQNTYLEYVPLISFEEKPCPESFLNSDEAYKSFGEHGSVTGYLISLGKLKTNEEKVALAKRFYESNEYLDKTSWLEENVPYIYEKTMLSKSRDYYLKNKNIDKQVISLMESKNYDKIKEIANDLKTKKSELNALYKAQTDKLPENAEFIKRVDNNRSNLLEKLKFD